MAQKKGGLIQKLIMGSEKSEGYARASLPSNRWELFFDILKGNFWRLVGINLLMLVFFLPLFFLLFYRTNVVASFNAICPFSQPFGVGYQSALSFAGFSESITLNVNATILLFIIPAILIAAIGIGGGAYVIRNMVWTEGVFVLNDFWKGIKQNFWDLFRTALLYSIVLYLGLVSVSASDRMIAQGVNNLWMFQISKIIAIVCLVFFTIVCFHMITLSVTYKQGFFRLIKNAFILSAGLIFHNIFFILLSLIPVVIMMIGGIAQFIGLMLLAFFGIAYCLLVWTDYAQWVFDKFINEKAGVQQGRGIYEKVKANDAEAIKKYKEQISRAGYSQYSKRPIKPITDEEITLAELPTSFSRKDIERLMESKQAMYEDNERYIEEHKDDECFKNQVERVTEQQGLAEKEREERERRIEKARNELKKRKRGK